MVSDTIRDGNATVPWQKPTRSRILFLTHKLVHAEISKEKVLNTTPDSDRK